jgi:hypothetical protein
MRPNFSPSDPVLLPHLRIGVLFISGDVHFGEIARFDCGTQYPLYDITSSGLTQSVENSVPAVFQSVMRNRSFFFLPKAAV